MEINLTITKIQEVNLKRILVKANVRYWEDSEVNGIDDLNGDLIPCRQGENWCPIIDVDSGVIENWEKGKTASIHYKVCDGFLCEYLDDDNDAIYHYDGYVPKFMCPKEDGYGNYIIMDISEDGTIANWDINAVKQAIETHED